MASCVDPTTGNEFLINGSVAYVPKRVAAGVTVAALNAQFPNSVPPDGAQGKLHLTGANPGEAHTVVALVYDTTLGKWVSEYTWEGRQTVNPASVTGGYQAVPAVDTSPGWIENYKDMLAAGLSPQAWIAAYLAAGSGGQTARMNMIIYEINNGDTASTVSVDNGAGAAGITVVGTTGTYVFQGWFNPANVSVPTHQHGLIGLTLGNDAGGSATATATYSVAKVRMVG